jgi:hypothetical protein
MKTARFLLACVAASLLAACNSDSITAPAVPATPAHPHFDADAAPGSDDGGYNTDTSGTGTGNCIRIIVVNPDGSVTTQCQVTANGQLGSGN